MSTKTDNRHLYLKVIDRIKEDIQTGVYAEKKSCLLSLSSQNF